jgi:hypothetical protein
VGDGFRAVVSCSDIISALGRPPSEVRFKKVAAALSLSSIRSKGMPVSRESLSADFPLECPSNSPVAKGAACRVPPHIHPFAPKMGHLEGIRNGTAVAFVTLRLHGLF